jgi:Na+-transporting methylmalonyl-CoA/oxaloacetate decarboxylase gamma subunit
MVNTISSSLIITLLGMGLVFGAILLFWLFMSGLVRLASDEPDGEQANREAAALDAAASGRAAARDAVLRRQAALAAALAALAISSAEDELEPGHFPLPPTALVSSWQAVMRARHLTERGSGR